MSTPERKIPLSENNATVWLSTDMGYIIADIPRDHVLEVLQHRFEVDASSNLSEAASDAIMDAMNQEEGLDPGEPATWRQLKVIRFVAKGSGDGVEAQIAFGTMFPSDRGSVTLNGPDPAVATLKTIQEIIHKAGIR